MDEERNDDVESMELARLSGPCVLKLHLRSKRQDFLYQLDRLLGNSDGYFELEDDGFSYTASNIGLEGNVLRADLQRMDQTTRRDEIAIAVHSEGDVPLISLGSSSRKHKPHTCVEPVESMELTRTCLLKIRLRSQDFYFQLNRLLGNENGTFCEGGGFSYSASNIGLEGNILYADLQRMDQTTRRDEISIKIHSKGSVPLISLGFGKQKHRPDQIKDCRNLVLRQVDDVPILTAECRGYDGIWRDSCLNLDSFLGNKDGFFESPGGWFFASGDSFELVGTTLFGRLRKYDGFTMSECSVSLQDILRVDEDGVLVGCQGEEFPCNFAVVRDECPSRKWLKDARNIRLIHACNELRRIWILAAECQGPDGQFRDAEFRLDDVLGLHYDEVFDGKNLKYRVESDPYMEDVTLVDGILTATFDCSSITPGSDINWEQRSVDLGDVVVNEDGSLVLKKATWSCSSCSELYQAGVFYMPHYKAHRVQLDLDAVTSTRNDCVMCGLVYDAAHTYTPADCRKELWIESKHGHVELTVKSFGYNASLPETLHKSKSIHKHVRHDGSVELRFKVMVDVPSVGIDSTALQRGFDPPRINSPKQFRTISGNTVGRSWLESAQRLSVFKEWIDVCLTEHAGCRKERAASLPSRYLDIGLTDDSPVRVVNSSSEHGEYACLSHCWGGKNFCILDASTEAQFREEVPRDRLPQVFVDAIRICRSLGIQRLWIDSLCIQQDSKEDWLRESQKMGAYYSNCLVCIAATSAPNSEHTIAISERADVIRSQGHDPEKGDYSLIACPTMSIGAKTHFTNAYYSQTLRRHFPLMTRAWTLQERWLSPRVLHFCSSEVIFECTELTTCECRQAELPAYINPAWNIQGPSRRTTTFMWGLTNRRQPLKFWQWRRLVSTYSALNLTEQTDRLIAVSALAAAFYEVWRSEQQPGEQEAETEYLAGLWRHTLAADLAWYVGGGPTSVVDFGGSSGAHESIPRVRSRPSEYLAPSWSWASLLTPVRYLSAPEDNDREFEQRFEVLDTHIVLDTDDRFSNVAEGCHLHLRGQVLESLWELKHDVFFVLMDLVGTHNVQESDSRGVTFCPDFEIEEPGPDNVSEQCLLWVFPLYTQLVQIKDARDEEEVECKTTACLVLRKREGEEKDGLPVYERVGFTEYTNNVDGVRDNDPNEYEEEEFVLV